MQAPDARHGIQRRKHEPCIIKQSIIINSSRDNEADLAAHLDNKAMQDRVTPSTFATTKILYDFVNQTRRGKCSLA
jgi:hypothetical protein